MLVEWWGRLLAMEVQRRLVGWCGSRGSEMIGGGLVGVKGIEVGDAWCGAGWVNQGGSWNDFVGGQVDVWERDVILTSCGAW